MPSKIELAIEQTLKSCNALKDEVSELTKSLKPRSSDYEKAIQMFYNSEDWIKVSRPGIHGGPLA